jgi:hypothetical protein
MQRSSNIFGFEATTGAGGGYGLYDYASGDYDIWFNSTGVGIGTESPANQLHVEGDTNGGVQIEIDNQNNGNASYAGLYLNGQGNNFFLKNWGDQVAGKSNVTEFLSTASGSEFAFSTVSTERMRIDSSGAVTKPMQPGFSVKFSSSSDVDLTATGYTTIPFNSERWDNNGDFNTGTYTFTAPVTGKYQFDYSLGMNSMDNSNTWFAILIQTSNQSYHDWIAPDDMFTGGDLSGNFTMKTSAVADMDANDTCYARVYIYNGTASEFTYMGDDRISYMTGYLLG